eukprot:753652-Hanusia_phi.AAC.3
MIQSVEGVSDDYCLEEHRRRKLCHHSTFRPSEARVPVTRGPVRAATSLRAYLPSGSSVIAGTR